MLEEAKLALRITSSAYDSEINELLDIARADLGRAGIVISDETDPLIRRALIWYCKAYFGFDNPDAERYAAAYDALRIDLALAVEYTKGDS